MNRLPGITKIRYVYAETLTADISLRAMAGVPVAVYADSFPVTHIGDAVCETDSQFMNNGYIEKALLSFSSLDDLPTHHHLCFIIDTVNGCTYLIGTKEHPFTIIKKASTTGATDNEKAVNKYTVSYSNLVALVPCNA